MNLFSSTNPNQLLSDAKSLMGEKWFNILDKNKILSMAEFLNEIKTLESNTNKKFYPNHNDCMRSLKLIDPYDVNVIILSKCPYPNDNADGIPFSCARYHSESIKQIYFGITEDDGFLETDKYMNKSMKLDHWPKQGILILNEKFRVLENDPNSLKDKRWADFITHILNVVHRINNKVIFCAWGSEAKSIIDKYEKINPNKKKLLYYLTNEHPIKASRSKRYWYCSHFKMINEILSALNKNEIQWLI